jgi:Tol biopolymer transport system component
VIQEGKQSLWVYDLKRETWNRLTSEDDPELLPTWTPDGEFIAFRAGNGLAWTRSDGSGKVELLAAVKRDSTPWSFSPDGKWLAFSLIDPRTGRDLWIVPMDRTPNGLRPGQPQPLLQDPGSQVHPALSPDGRWVAYMSDESGHYEIFVIPFSPQGPAGGGKWQVSNGGGRNPIWSRNGRELFYEGPENEVHVAAYTVKGNSFVVEKPRVWSETRLADPGNRYRGFDVSADGKRVLGLLDADDAKPETHLRVLLNVDSELRRRISMGGK